MTDEELAVYGVTIDVTPSGVYFVSYCGWGRRVGTDATEARRYAERICQQGLHQP